MAIGESSQFWRRVVQPAADCRSAHRSERQPLRATRPQSTRRAGQPRPLHCGIPTWEEEGAETAYTCLPMISSACRKCQQIRAHPRDRNASWMSARFSYRRRRRRK